jgi:ADP-ribosylation factor-like protein 6
MGFFKMIATALGFKSREARIIVIGLDNSGKTTLIQHLKPKKVGKTVTIFHPKIMMALYSLRQAKTSEVTPTVGFTIEEFSKNNISFTVYDMSGQGRYRSLWEYYYSDVQAIIYVLDSTDRIRMCVAKEELEILLNHAEIKPVRIPVLFFANKVWVVGSSLELHCTRLM